MNVHSKHLARLGARDPERAGRRVDEREKRTVSGDNFESVDVISPALQLISHSIVTCSPGVISVTHVSLADSAYFRFPCFGIVRNASIGPHQFRELFRSCRHGSSMRSMRLTTAERISASATVTNSAANTREIAYRLPALKMACPRPSDEDMNSPKIAPTNANPTVSFNPAKISVSDAGKHQQSEDLAPGRAERPHQG